MSLEVVYPQGGVVTLSGAGGASESIAAGSSQVNVTVTGTGALTVALPLDEEVGALKKVCVPTINTGASLVLTGPAEGAMLNGSTVVATATVAEADAGACMVLQHLVGGTWKLLQVDGTVTLA